MNWRTGSENVGGLAVWHRHSVWEGEGMWLSVTRLSLVQHLLPSHIPLFEWVLDFTFIGSLTQPGKQSVWMASIHARIPSSSYWRPFCSMWWYNCLMVPTSPWTAFDMTVIMKVVQLCSLMNVLHCNKCYFGPTCWPVHRKPQSFSFLMKCNRNSSLQFCRKKG